MAVPLMRLPWPSRTLRRGDTGEGVRWLQERLREQGYEVGPVDGKYGFITEDAVMAFQRDRRLRVDGVAGHEIAAGFGARPAAPRGLRRLPPPCRPRRW